ncbi:MAG: hypothetical protein KC910_08425 [Candidatus Eremiobacteraeota bacterium]|nr:hypothetical protein [Candidatus Eremiobacteraeota bacterium]
MRWGIEKIRAGEWTMDIYQSYLRACHRIVLREAEELKTIYSRSKKFKIEEAQLVAGIEEAMAMFMEGIETFYAYTQEGDESLLDAGIEIYKQANRKFYKLYLYVEDSLEEFEVKFDM